MKKADDDAARGRHHRGQRYGKAGALPTQYWEQERDLMHNEAHLHHDRQHQRRGNAPVAHASKGLPPHQGLRFRSLGASRLGSHADTMTIPPTPPPVSATDMASPRFLVNHSPTMLATAALVSIAKAGAMAR